MATWRVNNSTTIGGKVCAEWVPNTAYSLGARVVCRVAYGTQAARAFVYECTSAGTSHATTEPSWPTTVGNTVVDNGATWTCRSPSDGSWDNASCYLQYLTNHAVAAAGGDTILVDKSHSESRSDAYTIKMATTQETPLNIICVDKDDSDSLSVGAIVSNIYKNLIIEDGALYSYGVTYSASGNSVIVRSSGLNTHAIFEHNGGTVFLSGWGNTIIAGNLHYVTVVEIVNGDVDCSTRAYGLEIQSSANLEWRGGEFKANASLAAVFVWDTANDGRVRLIGVDLSSIPATCEILGIHATEGYYDARIRDIVLMNCKLPATFAGMFNNTPKRLTHYFPWNRPVARNCGNGNTVYEHMEAGGSGTITHNTSIYNAAGASNGTTNFSMKMVSSDKNKEMFTSLISTEITGWTSSTTEKTFTIEGIWDSATNIQDDEIWMELRYPANNSDPLCAFTTDRCAILGTPADQATSSVTWTGTGGFSNENKFKLSVTVTPGKAGPICARVYLAKASTTVYIDPMITES